MAAVLAHHTLQQLALDTKISRGLWFVHADLEVADSGFDSDCCHAHCYQRACHWASASTATIMTRDVLEYYVITCTKSTEVQRQRHELEVKIARRQGTAEHYNALTSSNHCCDNSQRCTAAGAGPSAGRCAPDTVAGAVLSPMIPQYMCVHHCGSLQPLVRHCPGRFSAAGCQGIESNHRSTAGRHRARPISPLVEHKKVRVPDAASPKK